MDLFIHPHVCSTYTSFCYDGAGQQEQSALLDDACRLIARSRDRVAVCICGVVGQPFARYAVDYWWFSELIDRRQWFVVTSSEALFEAPRARRNSSAHLDQ